MPPYPCRPDGIWECLDRADEVGRMEGPCGSVDEKLTRYRCVTRNSNDKNAFSALRRKSAAWTSMAPTLYPADTKLPITAAKSLPPLEEIKPLTFSRAITRGPIPRSTFLRISDKHGQKAPLDVPSNPARPPAMDKFLQGKLAQAKSRSSGTSLTLRPPNRHVSSRKCQSFRCRQPPF
jgi:hypothetical protein